MSAVLDVCICAIMILTVVICAKRGFFKSLIKIGSVIAAILAVVLFSAQLKARLLETKTCSEVREKMNVRLAEIVSSEADEYDPADVKRSPKFVELLGVLGIRTETFDRVWDTWRAERTDEVREKLVNYVSEPLMDMLAQLLSFVILFFGTLIAVRVIGFVLDKIFVLPVLKQANTLLGLVLGVIMALVYACAFVYLVNLALPYLQARGFEQLARISADKTYVFKWFAEHDVIAALLGK